MAWPNPSEIMPSEIYQISPRCPAQGRSLTRPLPNPPQHTSERAAGYATARPPEGRFWRSVGLSSREQLSSLSKALANRAERGPAPRHLGTAALRLASCFFNERGCAPSTLSVPSPPPAALHSGCALTPPHAPPAPRATTPSPRSASPSRRTCALWRGRAVAWACPEGWPLAGRAAPLPVPPRPRTPPAPPPRKEVRYTEAEAAAAAGGGTLHSVTSFTAHLVF
jgi:hypothetical protein